MTIVKKLIQIKKDFYLIFIDSLNDIICCFIETNLLIAGLLLFKIIRNISIKYFLNFLTNMKINKELKMIK